MHIGRWALTHRAAVLLSLVVAVLAGAMAARGLASGVYPEVDFPRIVVVARVGDAPPEVFQTAVTRPLEGALVTVLGVQRVRSRTIRGAGEISLQFVAGTDMWRALQLVESRVNQTRNALPSGTEVEVERLTPTAFPVVTFNLAGPLDSRDLRDLGEFVVRPALARVSGVGQVKLTGGDVREIEVILDPERTAASHLLPQDIALRVREALGLTAVGRTQQDRQSMTVTVSGEERTPEGIAALPITHLPDGTAVTLGSLADVREGASDRSASVGGPRGATVLLSVSRLEGASTPDVVRAVEAVARGLRTSLPPGVTLEPVYDQATLVSESIASVRDAILLGIVLCVLVLGVSLRDVRAGLLAAATVPVTLSITFAVMQLLHETLNLMSLGGMAVAVGLVIDDAIVVVEAIARRMEHGEDPETAAAEGTSELGPAVVGTTLTTVIVFVPLAFIEGMVGDFFSALAGTLSAAVLISMVVALVGIPASAARFMRARPARPRARLEALYGRVADWGARRRWVGLLMVAMATATGAYAVQHVPSEFLPKMDEGAFVLDYFLPAGTSLEETEAVAQRLERILRESPSVQSFSRRTGAELGPAAATTMNRGDIMVSLRGGARRRPTEDVIHEVRERVAREVPEARVEFIQVLQDVLNDLSGAPHPLEVKLFGEDPAVLREIAAQASEKLEAVHGLVDVYGGVEDDTPTWTLRPRRDALMRAGTTLQALTDTLSASLAGHPAGAVRRFDRLVNVRVRYPDAVRFNPEVFGRMPLVMPSGEVVSTSAMAELTREMAPSQVEHEGLQPVVILTADLEGRDLGATVRDARRALATVRMPAGYRMEIGGQTEAQAESFAALAKVVLLGLLLTLVVMVAQFGRVRPALAVMLTVPFALTGALVTLWATGTALNASSLMGCVLLVGLEVKSGIILLEVAEAHAALGHSYVESLAVACRRRIRPIALTTTATLAGVAPLAFGIGAGAEIQRPLATAVLGGLLIAKFLNLLALPSLAVLLHGRDPKPETAP